MKKSFLLIFILFLALFFSSCKASTNFPKLKIENNTSATIISVSLDEYSFSNLNIENSQTKLFDLKDGLKNGYTNISVDIKMAKNNIRLTTQCNFEEGKITSINVKGLDNSKLSVSYE